MEVVLVSGRAGSGKTKAAEKLYREAVGAGREVSLYDEGELVAQHLPELVEHNPMKISTAVADRPLTVERWYA